MVMLSRMISFIQFNEIPDLFLPFVYFLNNTFKQRNNNINIIPEGEAVKLLFVTFLLATGLISFFIAMDLLMGTSFFKLIWNAINPFRVMEIAEYVILFIFVFILFIEAYVSYRKTKNQKTPPQN
jgi:hypothetical protein